MHDTSEFVCCVCKQVPVTALESKCCHSIMCWDCVIAKSGLRCPSCIYVLQAEDFVESVAINKILEERGAPCRFQGCPQRLRSSERRVHEANCRYANVLCPNSELCGIFSRETLRLHDCPHRLVQCHLCELSLPLSALEGHLQDDCDEAVVECPQGCGASSLRKDMERHQAVVCPQSLVPCPLQPMCSEMLRRCDVDDHVQHNSVQHITLLQQRMMAQETEIQNLRARVSELDHRRLDLTEMIPLQFLTQSRQRVVRHWLQYVVSLSVLVYCVLASWLWMATDRIKHMRRMAMHTIHVRGIPTGLPPVNMNWMIMNRAWVTLLFGLTLVLLPRWVPYLFGFVFMLLSMVGVCRSGPGKILMVVFTLFLYSFIYNKLKVLLLAMILLKVVAYLRAGAPRGCWLF